MAKMKKPIVRVFSLILFSVLLEKLVKSSGLLRTRTTKTILLWNKPHRIDSGRFNATCPVTDCRIIRNYNDLPFESYDAVVFNMLDYEEIDFPEELVPNRRVTGASRTLPVVFQILKFRSAISISM